MESSLDRAFVELRSLMNAEALDAARRDALWVLLERAALEAPVMYRERWLPYMEGFPHHFVEPLHTVRSLKELQSASALVPRAHFRLDLSPHGICLWTEGARALAASPYLARLTSLELKSNRIGAEGARALAESPHLAHLTSLHLEDNNIGTEGARALAASPYLARLTSLNLSSN